MGLIGASFGVGFVLGPAIGGLLSPFGNHVPMLAAAGLAASNAVYAACVLREPTRHQASGAPAAGRLAALRDPLVRRLCLVNLVFSLAVTPLETIFAFFMADRFGYDARHVAFILVGMAVVMGAVQGGGMRALSARYAERRLVLWGSLLLLSGLAAMTLAPSVPVLLVPLTLAAIGRGIAQPSLMSLASLSAAASERGVVMGTFQSAASLARVIGPVVAGVLYDRSISSPFLLAAALLAGVALLAVRLEGR
jgi:predicted MFS family arabinose efflux permease